MSNPSDARLASDTADAPARVASLEAEVLRLREATEAVHQRAYATARNAEDALTDIRRLTASALATPSAPTPEAPPSKSVQRRLAAQGAPASGQGAAATPVCSFCSRSADDVPNRSLMVQNAVTICGDCAADAVRTTAAPAPAAQPATETCGTCKGKRMVTYQLGRPTQYEGLCNECGGTGTTPRKEGP